MMHYSLSLDQKEQHYLEINFSAKVNGDTTYLQLPSWRPGRYELTDFAKNIQKLEVFDEKGDIVFFKKNTKDSWEVNTKNIKEITVKYNYYSIDFNAGSTYIDSDVLYVNPVNCFLYIPEKIGEKCEVDIPKKSSQKIACGLAYKAGKITTKNFHELADTPFIVSELLQRKTYIIAEITFAIWFYGECKPNWDLILHDFKKFTQFQIEKFGEFPVQEYHFINIIHPYKAYHGVEHKTSTVIALGPSYEVMEGLYTEFLGVSSHELYHTWNIKTIRPKEMLPYDYTKENYSKLGYVAEGVTTYMGDLVLYESGVFDRNQYILEFNQYLKKHYQNHGRLNLSVSDSSFDTWLDGYQQGIPDRKTSIYIEGALVSFLIDWKIREATKSKKSLHTVMNLMYERYGKKEIGYTEQDYKTVIEEVSGLSFTIFFNSYIWGLKDFTTELKKYTQLAGFNFNKNKSKLTSENYGLIVSKSTNPEVIHVMKDSVGYKAGLSRGDKIIAVNNYPVMNDLDKWLTYFEGEKIEITRVRNGVIKLLILNQPNANQFWEYVID